MGLGEDSSSQMSQQLVEICKIGVALSSHPPRFYYPSGLLSEGINRSYTERPPGTFRRGKKATPPFKLCLLLSGKPSKSKGACLYIPKI